MRAARAFAAACLLLAGQAQGQVLESVVMPGKVIEGHAKLEAGCGNCHKRFDKAAQARLCLDCHKDVAADAAAGRGYHGRSADVRGRQCRECHSDHKGRDARIAAFDPARFDHATTDYALRGAHAKPGLECRSCHASGRRWREAPGECVECHRMDDAHKGSLGAKCADCHDERTWKEARFDHGRTKFALEGKHAGAKCRACHDKGYRDTPVQCNACHRKDDAHKGRYGEKCETCHDARDWANRFPHDTKTRFALGGKHRAAKCDSCHKGALHREKLPLQCVGCHRADDVHKGAQGEDCAKCHGDRTWKSSTFDHDKDTKFALRGKHRAAKCDSCHKPGSRQSLATACLSCHGRDDAHKGAMGQKCEACHGERDWKETRFDHDRDTKYALKGRHRGPKCEACHREDAYRKKAPVECLACHRKDDAHKGQEGERCADCHDERGWKGRPFDHALSRFPLVGAHFRVACASCHKSPLFRDAPRECDGCHAKDDAHERRLGPRCESCHNARTWRSWDFDHAKRTKYPLEGGHRAAKCVACHTQPTRGNAQAPTACYACHRAEDVHAGAFGVQCERCHGPGGWRELRGGAIVAPPRQAGTRG